MKATKQYFPVVLFIMLYKGVFTFASVNESNLEVTTYKEYVILPIQNMQTTTQNQRIHIYLPPSSVDATTQLLSTPSPSRVNANTSIQ